MKRNANGAKPISSDNHTQQNLKEHVNFFNIRIALQTGIEKMSIEASYKNTASFVRKKKTVCFCLI